LVGTIEEGRGRGDSKGAMMAEAVASSPPCTYYYYYY